jgi:hypothetical protein
MDSIGEQKAIGQGLELIRASDIYYVSYRSEGEISCEKPKDCG